ncbi:MFS transporter [Egibacter rhizosphaerae]|uniref:MFS transporter n=1 Tax=Egibacter rhizosphaerae TaxID=1670831 RepID=A0A411YB17_9ACTN|nr:OFA family MFS transporter [Egibacter rhizosphaerae]QBI18385.1 MFS transporter [Egibacter rhizosphaerae]
MSTENRIERSEGTPAMRTRWWMAAATFIVLFPLGGVYGWSVFVTPLQESFDWTWTQAMAPLMANIGAIFLGAYFGGRVQDRWGPRWVVVIGVVVFCVGVATGVLVTDPGDLWILVAGHGVLAGIGLGIAYIPCPALIVKWFPDQRGMAAGLATMGFGAGALLAGPAGEGLMALVGDVPPVFGILAAIYLVIGLPFAFFLKDPPESADLPDPPPSPRGDDLTAGEALRTWQWYALCIAFLANVTVGIALVTLASPIAQEVAEASAGQGAFIVGLLGVFNALGRPGLAALSDRVGRRTTYTAMLVVQALCFVAIPFVPQIVVFALLASIVALGFGGGFGITPAWTADLFGPEHNGAVFGAMIIAWSAGGVIGPLVTSELRDLTGSFEVPLYVWAVVAFVAAILPAILARAPERIAEGGETGARDGASMDESGVPAR